MITLTLFRATIVSNAGVSALANGCPELEWISLHGTVVSDNSVTALCSSCSRLRTVNISMTRVTTRSLRTLAGKDSLRCARAVWNVFRRERIGLLTAHLSVMF